MNLPVYYTNRWLRTENVPDKIWQPDRARVVFNKRERLTVVAGDLKHPVAFVEFYRDWIGVSFLDAQLRVNLNYSFREIERGRVFLTMATSRHFLGESDEVTAGTSYIFKPDGTVNVRENDVLRKGLREGKGTADVSGNWDFYPSFGEYDSLLRVDRPSITFAS